MNLDLLIFTIRALFISGITIGSFKVGMFSGSLIIGSVLTFNQDILDKKENGLMFCYHCLHQIDPKAKATIFKALDADQSLVSFPCETCRKDNYFPISPKQKERAMHGGILYGKFKEIIRSGNQHINNLSND